MTPPPPDRESGAARFWQDVDARSVRRGSFWVPGDRVDIDGQTYQRGPMFVDWEAPEVVTRPYPIVLVHGGAVQGTEWTVTPDGRPGWSQRLVDAGYVVLVVDRPTQGRSPFHPDITGPMGPAFSYQEGRTVFFPREATAEQTQWPFDPDTDGSALDEFIAAYGPLPADIVDWQQMDADRLAALVDRIGPAIVMTHSASGSDGWLLADRRPDGVVAIVTVEPMGPPFAETPSIGTLHFGLTAAPIRYDPPRVSAADARAADPSTLTIPALRDLPIAVVSGETSAQAKYAPDIVGFLRRAGAAVDHIHLPDHGVYGNGHGLIYESNSDATLQPVLDWLDTTTATTPAQQPSRSEDDQAQQATLFVTYAGDVDATRFDREYYLTTHLPLVTRAWTPHGLLNACALFPEGEAEVIAVAVCRFRDAHAITAALDSPHTPEVMADVIHFTDAAPTQHQSVASG